MAIDEIEALRARVAELEAELRIERERTSGGIGSPCFEVLTETLHDGVSIIGPDGTSRYESPALERILGYEPSDHVGRSAFDDLHPDDLDRAEARFAELKATPNQVLTDEFCVLHADGEYRKLELRGVNLLDHPAVQGIVVAYRDVTETRDATSRLREADETLEGIGRRIPAVVYQTKGPLDGSRFEVPYISEGVERLWGVSREEIARNPWRLLELIHPEDRQHYYDLAFESMKTLEPFEAEFRIMVANGNGEPTVRHTRASSIPRMLPCGDVLYDGVAVDVTDEVSARRELAETKDVLDIAVDAAKCSVWSWDVASGRTRLHNLPSSWERSNTPRESTIEDSLRSCHPDDLERVRRELAEALRGERPYDLDYRFFRSDGSLVETIVRANVTRDEAGEPIRVTGVAMDVTERRRDREALRVARARLDTVIDAAKMQIWYRDFATGEVTCEGWRSFPNGFEVPARATTEEYTAYVHPEDLPAMIAASRDAVEGCGSFEMEHRTVYPGEDTLHFLTRGTVVTDDDGRPVGMVGASLDITARRTAEQGLAVTKDRLDLALRCASAGTWHWNPNTDVAVWDGDPHPLFGTSGTRTGTIDEFLAVILADDRAGIESLFQKTVASPQTTPNTIALAYRVIWPDGSVHHIRSHGYVECDEQGAVRHIAGVCWDVTDRKLAEDELRQAHQRLTFHMQNSPLAVLEWDAEMKIVRWSPRAETLFGWRTEEVLGRHWDEFRLIHDDDVEQVALIAERLVTGVEDYNTSHNRNYRKDGSVVHCEWHNSVVRDERGRLVSILSFAQDVTERDRALEELRAAKDELEDRVDERTRALREANDSLTLESIRRSHAQTKMAESESLLRSVLQAVPDTFFVADPTGRVRHVFSDRFHGHAIRENGNGRAIGELFPADFEETARNVVREASLAREPRMLEYRLPDPAGVIRVFAAHIVPFGLGSDHCALWAARDVTDARAAEDEIRRLNEQLGDAWRFTTAGELIAGVAHDLHQPLTAIVNYSSGYLHHLERGTNTEERQQEAFSEIRTAATRAGEIVEELKRMIRRQPAERQPLDVNELVVHAYELARIGMRDAGILVTQDLAAGLPLVVGQRMPLIQVVLNLLVNATDALKGNTDVDRRVTIRTSCCTDEESCVTVSVIDSGPGVPVGRREEIFKRFVTSKSTGMGLGLAASRSVVEAHGGRIWVEDAEPNGAAFRFTLGAATTAIFPDSE